MPELTVISDAFEQNGMIPAKYTADGEDVSPGLSVNGVPADAKSLALIVDDPDAPSGDWAHWVMWNIPVDGKIIEDTVPGEQGMNDFARRNYGGPAPPSGTHRYFFKVYALDTTLTIPNTSTKQDLLEAMEGHIVAYGELVGKYRRG